MTKKTAKKVRKAARPSAFRTMLGIFTAAGVRYRMWTLRAAPGLQEYDGNIIVVGSSGDEPYTTFCFDTTGALREVNSVATTSDQQVVVESLGRRTMTVITPFNEGNESRHITNPEEN